MRIAIDIRPTLKKEKTGIGYYTLNLVNSLAMWARPRSKEYQHTLSLQFLALWVNSQTFVSYQCRFWLREYTFYHFDYPKAGLPRSSL